MFLKQEIRLSFLIVLAIMLIFHKNTFAQSAAIEGTVIDSVTKAPLPSANIILKGTSIGTASTDDGEFAINNILQGTYIIKTTYVGYRTNEFRITLKANRTLKTIIKLNPVSINGKTVTVTSQAGGQYEAINKQLNSDQIENVVSRAQIQALPDQNAAEAAGRLPGVTVIPSGGVGAELAVRGLSPQYNQITIEGVQLPSNVETFNENSQYTDVGDRATDISMISSSMLGGIEIINAITPDMDAAVLGGVVNFNMRKAEVDSSGSPSFDFLMQGDYNGLKNTYNDYQFVGTYQQRFFSQKLGLLIQGDIQRRNGSYSSVQAYYNLDDKSHGDQGVPNLYYVGLGDELTINETKNVQAVLDYKHSNGDIGFMNWFTTNSFNPIDRYESINSIRDGNTINYFSTESKNKSNTIINLLRIKQEIPLFNLDLKFSHAYTENLTPEILNSRFLQNDAGLGGLYVLSHITPKAFTSLAKPNDNLAVYNGLYVSSNSLRDRKLTGSVDLSSDYHISDLLTAKIKFGGMYQYQDRSFNYNWGGDLISSPTGIVGPALIQKILQLYPNMQTYIGNLTLTGFVDKSYWFGNFLNQYSMAYPINVNIINRIYDMENSTKILENQKYNSSIYDYHGSENKSAGYAMAKFKFGDLVTFLPGVRYQNLTTSYSGNRVIIYQYFTSYTDTTVTESHGYWLPMVHLIYRAFSWLQIHFAYTNTLNYPDYSIIIPSYTISYTGSINYNNYNLKPARSENFDLNFSFFNNIIGLFSIDGFDKRIRNLIFSETTYVSDLSKYPGLPRNYAKILYTFNTYINNPFTVDNEGIEAQWETHFWYLPQPFSWIVFNINYTHVFSRARYPKREFNVSYDEYGTSIETILNKDYLAPLLNTPDEVVNSSIGIDYKGFSGRLSLNYTNKIFSYADFWLQNRLITDKNFTWDISVRQKLPWLAPRFFSI